MEYTKILMGLLICIMCTVSVTALNCVYNDNIELQVFDTIDFYCEVDNPINDKCISMVFDGNSMIYSFPIDDMLALDKYEMTNGIGKITFDVTFLSQYMQSDRNFTYAVVCGDELWQRSIFTEYKNYDNQTVMVGVWMKNNLNYIVFLFILLLIAIITMVIIWKLSG